MSLAAGMKLGAYEVIAAIGAGGMGEVWRARDTKLNRDVALKILPDLFAHDAERVARFAREAQTLASLNHPNIATLFGIGEEALPSPESQVPTPVLSFLVMELVEGDDLSALIARGVMPPADALPIARQIADALEAAHEQGVVHRDLKPANIKVRADGTVKVLDFGLAKALDPAGASGSGIASNSPTLTARATQMGMIIGTAAYMAPEQAKGKAVDRRADIWAFGAVLYEMLTGRRAFPGEDISEVLASVLKSEPDWSVLPAGLSSPVRRLLRRCLEKDPRKRLSAIGDARFDLDDEDPPVAAGAPPVSLAQHPLPRALLLAALGGVAVAAVAATLLWPSSAPRLPAALARLSILPPPGLSFYPDSNSVAISPDGTMVAYVTGSLSQSDPQLWVRDLRTITARRLEGADGVTLLFWSPDSRRIGFFTNNKLKTIAVSGGRADVLCEAPNGRGAFWAASNTIVFAPDAGGPIYRIDANGGKPSPVTRLDTARKEYGHRFPVLLPDQDHFLYAALPGKNGQFDIFAGSLTETSRTFVATMDSAPAYADPGWLLTTRQGVLAALPFDARTLKVTGAPVTIGDEPVAVLDPSGSYTAGRLVSVSADGSLVYFSGQSSSTSAVWLDLSGRVTGKLSMPPGHYDQVAISPDGTKAILVQSTSPSESALWLADLTRGGALPMTSGGGRDDSPVWSPDGTRVAFATDRDGPQQIYVKTVGDAVPERLLFKSDAMFMAPLSWSRDGKWLVFLQLDRDTAQNLWALPMPGAGTATLQVRTPVRDLGGWLSPDGRWLLYTSEESGRFELYAQSFPEPGHKVAISQNGAVLAWWVSGGRQILFVGGDQRTIMRVDVESGTELKVGSPRVVGMFPPGGDRVEAMPDGQRFLGLVPEQPGTGSITVVQNWRAGLDEKR
jgi:eukaryotic-like serine/threonine-protein kinase